tara:strand:- start:589 stop:741 length:153 start_codon:yes stop_codon:yes gene_type:complete
MTIRIPVIPYKAGNEATSTKQDNQKGGCPPGFKKVNGKCVQKGVGKEWQP